MRKLWPSNFLKNCKCGIDGRTSLPCGPLIGFIAEKTFLNNTIRYAL